MKKKRLINYGKSIVFIAVLVLILKWVSGVFQPKWFETNNYYTINGFYEEPRNTFEAIVLGPSVVVNGINTMQLYQEHGICAYNLGTDRQPLAASYAWLEEAYRYHPETLKTILLDVSLLRQESPDAFWHKAFDGMRLSKTKFQIIWDYTEGKWDEALGYLIPLFSYHTRWNEIRLSDFMDAGVDPVNGTRGYEIKTGYAESFYHFVEGKLIDFTLNDSAEPAKLYEESVEYFEKMVEFCEGHGLQLVLIKTPTTNWNSNLHLAVQKLADEHRLPFFDFNYQPLVDELDYMYALDSNDEKHLNYYGATKLTNWLGNYLVTECRTTDVRGNERYSHMEEQLVKYEKNIALTVGMEAVTTVSDGIRIAKEEGATTFILVSGEVCANLTDALRDELFELGLSKLAALTQSQAYIAVLKDGVVVYEESLSDESGNGAYLTVKGNFVNGKEYVLVSDQTTTLASYSVDGEEIVFDWNGIYVVVCDEQTGRVLEDTFFDTNWRPDRDVYRVEFVSEVINAGENAVYEEDSVKNRIKKYLQRQETFNEGVRMGEAFGEGRIFEFLDACYADPNKVVMISVKDEASTKFTDEVRACLRGYGLMQLSELGIRDSYIGIIDGGVVMTELRGIGEAVSYADDVCMIESAGHDAGDVSSIIVNDIEYSPNMRGLNVVVYDKQLGEVSCSTMFDTYEKDVTVQE